MLSKAGSTAEAAVLKTEVVALKTETVALQKEGVTLNTTCTCPSKPVPTPRSGIQCGPGQSTAPAHQVLA